MVSREDVVRCSVAVRGQNQRVSAMILPVAEPHDGRLASQGIAVQRALGALVETRLVDGGQGSGRVGTEEGGRKIWQQVNRFCTDPALADSFEREPEPAHDDLNELARHLHTKRCEDGSRALSRRQVRLQQERFAQEDFHLFRERTALAWPLSR
jgi:hypothetical protein